MSRNTEQVRLLNNADLPLVVRLLQSSEYTYQRFTPEELPTLLDQYPAVGAFGGPSLRSFMLSQTVNGSSAWIGGFGVSWSESKNYLSHLDLLLNHLRPALVSRGARYLHYSGNDSEQDWLRPVLLKRNFLPYRQLYAYDKYDFNISTYGNQEVIIRPVESRDISTLLQLEQLCFEELWRYDAASFNTIAATHPYFVVAELNGQVIGYQFNALDEIYGYLVRIAVHPNINSKGIGARLMAEAIAFFQRSHVERIMLNTQDNNHHAHRLYEWFGFIRIPQLGFVLRRYL